LSIRTGLVREDTTRITMGKGPQRKRRKGADRVVALTRKKKLFEGVTPGCSLDPDKSSGSGGEKAAQQGVAGDAKEQREKLRTWRFRSGRSRGPGIRKKNNLEKGTKSRSASKKRALCGQ